MATLRFNNRYQHTRLSGLFFDPENNEKDVSRTQQQFGYETDINNIVKGMVPTNFNSKTPLFGSTFDPSAYENAVNIVADAMSKFESLPSDLRHRFNNDPKQLLAFVNNPANKDECIKLGFLKPDIVSDDINVIQPPKNPSEVTPVASDTGVSEVSSQKVST